MSRPAALPGLSLACLSLACLSLACLSLGLLGCSIVNDPSPHTEPAEGSDGGGVSRDAGGGVDAGPSLPKGDFCHAYATAFCEAIPSCCSTADSTPPDCVRALRDRCQTSLGEILNEERVEYDPFRAAATLSEGRTLVGGCATTPFLDWLTARERFLGPFRGTVAGGASCEPIGEEAPEQAVALVVCEDSAMICRGSEGARACQQKVGPGGPCTYRIECEDGLRCVRPGTTLLEAQGSCEEMGEPDGSHCRLGDECASLNCTATGFLVPGTCAPATPDDVYCR